MTDPAVRTEELVRRMAARDFDAVIDAFTAEMRRLYPLEALDRAFRQVLAEAGGLERIAGVAVEDDEEAGEAIVSAVADCHFERGRLHIRCVYDTCGRIAGMHVFPPRG